MCERVGNVILCGRRGGKSRRCVDCGGFGAEFECDGPVQTGGTVTTCDRLICRSCAIDAGPNRHYCRYHANPANRRLAL